MKEINYIKKHRFIDYTELQNMGFSIRDVLSANQKKNITHSYSIVQKEDGCNSLTKEEFKNANLTIELDSKNNRIRLLGENSVPDIDSGVGPWVNTNKKTYEYYVFCLNCHGGYYITIPKGIRTRDFLKNKKCPNCDCSPLRRKTK